MAYPPGALAQLCAQRGTSLTNTAASVGKTPQHFNRARNGGHPVARRHVPGIAAHWGCDPRTAARWLEAAGVRLGKKK
jgi:hypothetical protein